MPKYICLEFDKIKILEYPDDDSYKLVSTSFYSFNDAAAFLVSSYSRLPKFFQDKVDDFFCEHPFLSQECFDSLYDEFKKSQ